MGKLILFRFTSSIPELNLLGLVRGIWNWDLSSVCSFSFWDSTGELFKLNSLPSRQGKKMIYVYSGGVTPVLYIYMYSFSRNVYTLVKMLFLLQKKIKKKIFLERAVLCSLDIAVCLCFSSASWKGVPNKSLFVMKITHQPLPTVSQRNNKCESQTCHPPKTCMWAWVKGWRKKFALTIVQHNSVETALPAQLLSPTQWGDGTVWISLGSSFQGHSSHQHHKTEIVCFPDLIAT